MPLGAVTLKTSLLTDGRIALGFPSLLSLPFLFFFPFSSLGLGLGFLVLGLGFCHLSSFFDKQTSWAANNRKKANMIKSRFVAGNWEAELVEVALARCA